MKRWAGRTLWGLLLVLVLEPASAEAQSLLIPSESDWVDIGRVLSPGGSGAWDKHLGDDGTGTQGMASPSALIKKDGTYFLYYLGADGLRSTDGGVRHRSLGVATSRDGMNFTKFSGNPIIEFLPHNNEEEGIYSATAYLDSNNDIVLYYGAMDAGSSSSTSVISDIRLAVSSNGFNFTEIGEVASHDDNSVWGHGDELFPVYTLEVDGTHWVYYLAKGDEAYWDLGAVWGPTISQLNSSDQVLQLSAQIRGGSASMLIDDDKMIVPVLLRSGSSNWQVQMRTAPLNDPTDLSTIMEVYDWDQIESLLVYLDRDVGQWFLYYVDRAATGIYMKTAVSGSEVLYLFSDGFESGSTESWR